MAISRVATGFANASSVSFASHQAGDLILLFPFRLSSATTITPASGWRMLSNRVANSMSSRVAWCIASGSSTSSGTWTNAEWIAYAIYRDSVNYLIPGSAGMQGNSGGTTVQYPASTITDSAQIARANDSTSWFAAFVAIRSGGDVAAVTTAPTSMTNATSQSGVAGIHDTNGSVASWATTTVGGLSATFYNSAVLEVMDSGVAMASGPSRPLSRILNTGA